jgi:hypothetical protein
MLKKILVTTSIIFIFSACRFNVPKPALVIDPEPEQTTSTIIVPVTSSFNSLSRMIRDEIKNPLAKGVTPELDIKLLATESISTEELVKELVTPFTPGHYITIWKEGTRKVQKAVGCWLTPWKWGTCWKDIVEVFTYPVEVWVEPIEAVYRYVSKTVTNWLDKAYDVGAWINYDVQLKDFQLKPAGQDLEVVAKINTDLSVDYKQPVTPIPFGPTLKLKGILKCSIETQATFKINISINPDLSIKITLIDDGTEIDFTKICNDLAVKGLNIYQYINPQFLASKLVLKKVLEKSINKAINKQLADNGDILLLKDAVAANVSKLQSTVAIAPDIWFVPNALNAFVSQPYINNDGLNINIGLKCKPQVIFSTTEPKIDLKPLATGVSNEQPKVNVQMGGFVTYRSINDTLQSLLRSFVNNSSIKLPVSTGAVNVYPSAKKIVIGIDITKNNKRARKLGTIYVWGQVAFDETKEEFYFKDLDFTLESKNVLLKIISEATGKQLLAYLNKSSHFKIDKELNKLKQQLTNLKKETEFGTVNFNLKEAGISGVNALKDRLAVYVDLSGDAKFNFVYKPTIVPIPNAVADTVALFANDSRIVRSNKMAIANEKVADISPAFPLPIYNVGDTIWYQNDKGVAAYRLAEIKDKKMVGDTIIIMNRFGEVDYHIVTKSDLKQN